MNEGYEKRKNIILELLDSDMYVPMKEKELACLLQVSPEDRPELAAILNDLLREGRVEISKRGKYTLSKGKTFTGIFRYNPKGFGFVTVEGSTDDYYISPENILDAMNSDIVTIAPLARRHGLHYEAKIVAINERGIKEVVGTYECGKSKGYGFIVTDNRFIEDVFIAGKNSKNAVSGQKVVAKIIDYGGNGKKAEGVIKEILGFENDKGVDILGIIRGLQIPEQFPSEVMVEADKIPEVISVQSDSNRLDLRDTLMVTIDGEDAKDLDDAVSLEIKDDKYILGVHIADVSEYVKEGSALDKDALSRGCSVYLVDRVVPMLPVKLSNGICSLNAGEERFAMSCIMTIDSKGEVVDYKITESIINVHKRMNYSSVNKMLNNDLEEQKLHEDVYPMLKDMQVLAEILRDKRTKRGSIDFDMPESKITLDEKGVPISIKPYEANDATRLIEDFMLIANETVASHMFWQAMPFLYRVHETPDRDKMESLKIMALSLGYYLKGDTKEIHPKSLQSLINEFADKPEAGLMMRLTLRSMKQARYASECLGHFGLALKEYTHFTSPIRRYPDLQIHRILKDQLHGKLDDERISHYHDILDNVAKEASRLERRANEAEREVDKLKKAEYMEKRIGQQYEGIISGVTGFGVYVELPNTCEGLIHISKLPGDFYNYDEKRMVIEGERTGRAYKLGDTVSIIVSSVDLHLKTVDFDIV